MLYFLDHPNGAGYTLLWSIDAGCNNLGPGLRAAWSTLLEADEDDVWSLIRQLEAIRRTVGQTAVPPKGLRAL